MELREARLLLGHLHRMLVRVGRFPVVEDEQLACRQAAEMAKAIEVVLGQDEEENWLEMRAMHSAQADEFGSMSSQPLQ